MSNMPAEEEVMTDIEQLRENVIQAARTQVVICGCICEYCCNLDDALRSFDAALKPDPWALLHEARKSCYLTDATADAEKVRFIGRVDAALTWRKHNP